jgi:hypothetical protein
VSFKSYWRIFAVFWSKTPHMQLPVRRPDECIVNMDLHYKSNIGDCIHEKRSILLDRSVQTESDKQIYILFNSFVNFRLTRIDLELLILLNYILTKKALREAF